MQIQNEDDQKTLLMGDSSAKTSSKTRKNQNKTKKEHPILGKLTLQEKRFMRQTWDDFKGDVGLKTMLTDLDRGIRRRKRLIVKEDEEENEAIKQFKDFMNKIKPVKQLALFIYVILIFFEKPGWCNHSSLIDINTTEGYWYCNNADGTILNSQIPKLPIYATTITYLVCLSIMLAFMYCRDVYRQLESETTKKVQLILTIISVVNLVQVTIANLIIGIDTVVTNPWIRMLCFPYVNAFCRPMIVLLNMRSLRQFGKRYLQVIRASTPMFIAIVIYIFYFSWLGNRLFAGTIEGVENFGTLWDSFFYMFVLMTTANYPDVMLPSYNQNRLCVFFFTTYLIIGLYILMSLLLTIFYANYQERTDASIDKHQKQRNIYLLQQFRKYDENNSGSLEKEQVLEYTKEIHSIINYEDEKTSSMVMTDMQFEQLFKVLDKTSSNRESNGDKPKQGLNPPEIPDLILAYESWLYERKSVEQLEEMYQHNQNALQFMDKVPRLQKAITALNSPLYELVMNAITIGNLFTVFFRSLATNQNTQSIETWCNVQIAINCFMFLEMVVDLWLQGPIKAFKYHFRIWPESFCQILNVVAMVMYLNTGRRGVVSTSDIVVKLFELIVFIRLLKLLTLLNEIREFTIIGETLSNLMKPLKNLLGILAIILYLFAQIGMIVYGGKVTSDSPQIISDSSIPDNYFLVNFNDMCSSMITLFILMVVNNWQVIVQMYVDISDGHTSQRLFFIVFYYFGVIVGLNIIIAFAIDMYSAVERLQNQKDANREFLLRLANRIRDDDLAMERALRLQKRQQGLDSSESSDSLTDEEIDDQLRDKEISFKKDN